MQVRRGTGAGAGVNPLHVPYITRGIPTHDIASEESLDAIIATADRILAEIGIEFREDPETVRLFQQAGGKARDVGPEAWNVTFEPGLIRGLLATAPAEFTQHARNPAKSVRIGAARWCLRPPMVRPS